MFRENACKTKISQLDVVFGVQQDVSRFDISMDDLSLLARVTVAQRKAELCNDSPDKIFFETFPMMGESRYFSTR